MRKTLNKISKTILAAAIVVMAASGVSGPAHAVALKERSMIDGNMITLGDIFYDLPRDEARVLGPAPRPGHDMVLNARTLMRIAIALDLPWRPRSSADYVVLSRAATVVDNEMIEEALREGLIAEGVSSDFDIRFTEGTPEIILPRDMEPSVEISHLDINHKNNWFSATFAAPSRENPLEITKVSGRIDPLTNVPVLRSTLSVGDIIGKRDIEMKQIPTRQINGQPVLKMEQLVGMTPKRFLAAGKPIRTNEIEPPQVVDRGQNITMIFNNGGLYLTAAGKALQSGAKGDVIRVVNASSNRTIDAIITGEREVTIKTF